MEAADYCSVTLHDPTPNASSHHRRWQLDPAELMQLLIHMLLGWQLDPAQLMSSLHYNPVFLSVASAHNSEQNFYLELTPNLRFIETEQQCCYLCWQWHYPHTTSSGILLCVSGIPLCHTVCVLLANYCVPTAFAQLARAPGSRSQWSNRQQSKVSLIELCSWWSLISLCWRT